MAKLIAPLFSFGASGALADSLVFFTWKGLNVVRQYVVPANPSSTKQVTQRGFLHAAVDEVHDAMVYPTHPLVSADKSAFSLAASLHPEPSTWFNELVKILVDAAVDIQTWSALVSFVCTYLAATTATAVGWAVKNAVHTGFIKYGTSKTALLSSVAADIAAHTFSATLTGLVVGTTYYWQWQATPVANKTVLKSGIYVYTHLAP